VVKLLLLGALTIMALSLGFSAGAQDQIYEIRFVYLEVHGPQAVPFTANHSDRRGIVGDSGNARRIKVAHGSSPAVVEANWPELIS
jgi:hypothetical protein